jgi:hypothetical protein
VLRGERLRFAIPRNRRIVRQLGPGATRFLETALGAIGRILPHTDSFDWEIGDYEECKASWSSPDHREINVTIGIKAGVNQSIKCKVVRKSVPQGAGAIERTLDPREREICRTVAVQLSEIFSGALPPSDDVTAGLLALFDELVVARHLKQHHKLALDPERVFSSLRALAEQTYENKALAFGCVLDASRSEAPPTGARFPDDFLSAKRFRALSDAYYTAYLVSTHGAVIEFMDLPTAASRRRVAPRNFFPEWCRDLALESRESRLGMALTRNGDVLVFDGGTLRFTYRFGRWQFWNHTHLVDLLRNTARVQRVPSAIIPRVVTAIYRAALDVSFRRSGGMFVVLRNQGRISDVVRSADQIGSPRRAPLSDQFDGALPTLRIQELPRDLILELSALDGAIVLSNQGQILAYGAVLAPKRRGRIDAAEGSRTKAAIGASNYGIAVKISSDGDITVYSRGKEFIRV